MTFTPEEREALRFSTINSVWSSYGHTFISDDELESCLTCGAVYVLRATPDASHDGEYQANNGDEPQHCSGNTSMNHGYSGERESYAGDEHHTCNCLLCDS